MPPADTAPRRGLLRLLGTWDGMAVSIGVAIGAGIFATPGRVVAALSTGEGAATVLPSAAAILGVWALGGLIVLADGLILAELAAMRPRAGGHYVYLRAAYGDRIAFLYGWCAVFVTWPASIAAVAAAATEYAALLGVAAAPVALAVLVAPTLWHGAGLRAGSWTQDVLSYGKAAALLAFAAAAIALRPALVVDPGESVASGGLLAAGLAGLGIALQSVWWTYDGYADAVFVAEEVRDPGRAVPRALIGAVALLSVVYVALNAGFLLCLSPAEMAASKLVAADAAARLGGVPAVRAVEVLALLTVLGGASAMLMSGPRIAFAMARDGLAFAPLARVSRGGTPRTSLYLIAFLAIVYWSLGSFSTLLTLTVFVIMFFVALLTGALLVLRRREPDAERPFRVPLYPWLPLALLVVAIALPAQMLWRSIGAVTRAPPASAGQLWTLLVGDAIALPGVLLILLGLVAHELWRRSRSAG